MDTEFDRLKQTWYQLGKDDPLWAVLSCDAKRGGKWNPDDFLATGEVDVGLFHRLAKTHGGAPDALGEVMDFGSGAGRLCLAWSRRARQVTGVDISASMIEKAKALTASAKNIQFVLNERSDLSVFPDQRFDLVASYICLQHIPWSIAANYVREFGRICRPGGIVIFQLPTRVVHPNHLSDLRKFIVDHLPFGWGAAYRRWRHGTAAVFEMHFTPAEEVVAVAKTSGLREVHREPNTSGGVGTDGFIYVFKK
jgi:ubiquinone/menaquinone biosynthesis C-methylase UbiE